MNSIKETNFNFPGSNRFLQRKSPRRLLFRRHHGDGCVGPHIGIRRGSSAGHSRQRTSAEPDRGNQSQLLRKTLYPTGCIKTPDPNVTIGFRCDPFPVEMVVRGYLSGHAAREYKAGKRSVCGVSLPEGLKESDQLPHPIITPTTKAKVGHDEDISEGRDPVNADWYRKKITSSWRSTHSICSEGVPKLAAKRRSYWSIPNTNLENTTARIYLIDEVHTPDSSRYFYRDGY